MILPKREDGFFPELEDLPLLQVTTETGLWYGLMECIPIKKKVPTNLPVASLGYFVVMQVALSAFISLWLLRFFTCVS